MDKKEIFTQLKALAMLLGADVTKDVILAYMRIFEKEEFTTEQIKKAIMQASVSCKFFPRPVEFIELIRPQVGKEDATYLAGRIIDCISRFGWPNGQGAKEYMGPVAWNAVLGVGGWSRVCDTPENNLGTLRAQLRDNCLSALKAPNIKEKLERISNTNNQAERLSFQNVLAQPSEA